MTARHEEAPTEVRAHNAASTTDYTTALAAEHLATLYASDIADPVIGERGYRTVRNRDELLSLGFSEKQARVPTLLMPVYGPSGHVTTYQSRPDSPRLNEKSKPIKYETPSGSRMRLDVPPSSRPNIGNPNVPLFITEGIKKGDSLASHGLCAVALLGVWNWRGANEDGGKVALGEWEDIALNGRDVTVVFDSDVMTKVEVQGALERLARFLRSRGARVRFIYLPDTEDGQKQGVDDFLASGHATADLLPFISDELRVTTSTERRIARAGGDAILDAPTEIPALLGTGSDVLHASGEALMVVGPDGVGKTTLVQQYALALMGLSESLLGLPVKPLTGTLLYLAMDRPQQAKRSMRRMVSEADRDVLNARLRVWEGPMPLDILTDPLSLLAFVREQAEGVQVVVVDSLKDAVLALAEDKTGGAWNMARQHLLANGIEVVEIHHQRKQQNGSPPPRSLADVYGSRWLTAGAGSVVCLWGDAGDPVVAFSHLKQPANEVGPFNVLIDHETGHVTRAGDRDLLTILRGASGGLTIPDLAGLKFEKDAPSKAEQEKVRRELRRLDGSGLVREQPASKGGSGGSTPARWFAAEQRDDAPPEQSRSNHAPPLAEVPTEQARQSRSAHVQIQESNHASNHANHGDEQSRFPASLEGGNACETVDENDFDAEAAGVKTWATR